MLSLNAADPPKAGIIMKVNKKLVAITIAFDIFMVHTSFAGNRRQPADDRYRILIDDLFPDCRNPQPVYFNPEFSKSFRNKVSASGAPPSFE